MRKCYNLSISIIGTVPLNTSFSDHILLGLNNLSKNLPSALFDILFGILIIQIVARMIRLALRATHVQPALTNVLSSVIEIFMWALLVMTVLGDLGYSGIIFFFTGSVAAFGIAMAAGGSTLISDIVAGVFLARDPDFAVGSEVIVGETPTRGVIESMDARRTRLRDNKGVLHIVPNSIVERKEWVLLERAPETTALAKATNAAKRLTAAARERRANRRNDQ